VRQLIDLCCSARGIHLEPLLTSNNSSAMHHFARLTGTITLGSAIALQRDDRADREDGDGAMVAKRIDEPLLNERRLQVTAMKDRRLPPAVEQFLNELKGALDSGLSEGPAAHPAGKGKGKTRR
jgi:hypothetical protein